jgi:hypothetical protein
VQEGREELCRDMLKDNLSCVYRVLKSFRSFDRANCDATEETSEGRRACKDGVEGTIELFEDGFEQSREAGFAGCANWLEACRVSCFPT